MSDLFTPFNLSGMDLANRIVMAPMTRARAPEDIATDTIALYYTQRATAGLIVSEGTPVSREGQGYLFNPGIFTPEQIKGWRLTTQSVHAVGGRIFAQLWHVGRMSHPSIQHEGRDPVSASAKQPANSHAFGYDADGNPGFIPPGVPRALDTDEIARVVADFAQAAANAIEAGFDGVEIHSANGYLFEQFLNPHVNARSDRYGAVNMDDRLRFALEVVDAVCARIGAARVGVRISPYGRFADMPHHDEIDATYLAYARALGERGIAYVHLNDQVGPGTQSEEAREIAARFHALLAGIRKALPTTTAVILAGSMTRERGEQLLGEGIIDLVAFGQPFIANPDLVARLENGWPLATPDRETYYGGDARGLVDYPPYARSME